MPRSVQVAPLSWETSAPMCGTATGNPSGSGGHRSSCSSWYQPYSVPSSALYVASIQRLPRMLSSFSNTTSAVPVSCPWTYVLRAGSAEPRASELNRYIVVPSQCAGLLLSTWDGKTSCCGLATSTAWGVAEVFGPAAGLAGRAAVRAALCVERSRLGSFWVAPAAAGATRTRSRLATRIAGANRGDVCTVRTPHTINAAGVLPAAAAPFDASALGTPTLPHLSVRRVYGVSARGSRD